MQLLLNIANPHPMMELSNPAALFGGQKIYRLPANVEKPGHLKPYKVIVVYGFSAPVLPAHLQALADKIIDSCRFSNNEALYVNAEAAEISLGWLQNSYSPHLILVFGEIGLSRNLSALKKNVACQINGVKIIKTDTLEQLDKSKADKTAFWGALQKSMGLK
jgi:hypothetical protein